MTSQYLIAAGEAHNAQDPQNPITPEELLRVAAEMIGTVGAMAVGNFLGAITGSLTMAADHSAVANAAALVNRSPWAIRLSLAVTGRAHRSMALAPRGADTWGHFRLLRGKVNDNQAGDRGYRWRFDHHRVGRLAL
jgi:hypothetical protein